MKHEFAYEEAQRHLRQRNRFAALASVLGLTSLLAVGAAATREESVILVPVTSERLTLGSDATDAHYLELVTRDTALMLLNRAPESLDYWMEQVLKVADPAAHGSFKAELVKIVDEQRGSDISQAFVISRMEVEPAPLATPSAAAFGPRPAAARLGAARCLQQGPRLSHQCEPEPPQLGVLARQEGSDPARQPHLLQAACKRARYEAFWGGPADVRQARDRPAGRCGEP